MSAGRAAPSSAHGWRIATVRGVPVFIGRSWPVIAAVIVISFGPQVSHPRTGAQGGLFGYAVAVAYALLLLASVLTHEAAHAVVARRFRYRVDRIVADLWGGHTVYDSSTARPGASAAIAVAGPLGNLALAGVSYLVGTAVGAGVLGLLLGALTLTNAFVGFFNLLPGLPLDGGYLVDSLVWKITGDRNRGLIVAGWLGRVLTVVLLVLIIGRPLLQGQPPSLFTVVWGGLIGAFLWSGATNAIRAGNSRRVIERVMLSEVLRPVLVVRSTDSAAQVLATLGPDVELAQPGLEQTVVVIGPSGQPAGVVDLPTLRGVEAARRAEVPVTAAVARQPDGWVVVAERADDVSGVISAIVGRAQLEQGAPSPRMVLVVSAAGEVLGTVSVDDLNTAFG